MSPCHPPSSVPAPTGVSPARTGVARVAGLALVLGAGLGVGGCGGSHHDGDTPNGPTGEPTLQATQSGDAASYIRQTWERRSAPSSSTVSETGNSAPTAPAPVASPSPGGAGATDTHSPTSGTPLQEQGVDEDDWLKVDGGQIYSLQQAESAQLGQSGGQVQIYPKSPSQQAASQPEPQSRLPLPALADDAGRPRGLYVLPGTGQAAVLSERVAATAGAGCASDGACTRITPASDGTVAPAVWIDRLDAAAPTSPRWTQRLRFEGRLVDSRRVGNALVVVTQHVPAVLSELWALSPKERASRLAQLKSEDVLPTYAVNDGSPQPLVTEGECHWQPGNASTDMAITTVSVLDLSVAQPQPRSHCVLGGTEAIYMSTDSLYLATTRWAYRSNQYASDMKTDVHKFSLSLTSTDYRGSAELAGHLGWNPEMKPYRFSEHEGDLRVLTFTGSSGWQGTAVPMAASPNTLAAVPPPAASPATLYVLREQAGSDRLALVGQLPNAQRPAPLGKPGEQVYAVRMMGSRGYVVTFRRTDPLYVLDLSDPTDPKALGAVEAAGFSNYLFPVGDGLLLGVGKQASASGQVGGVKVALFDVRDGLHPRELAAKQFGMSGSGSALEVSRHGIDLATRGPIVRVALPLWLYGGNYEWSASGLQRLEINTQTGTLSERGWIDSPARSGYDLATERSVQVDDQLYYLSGGGLSVWDW